MPEVKRPSSRAPTRPERLAVNLFDLDRINPDIRSIMLAGRLDLEAGAVRMDPERMDEAGVLFSCDLLTAACICDTMRSHDRAVGDYPTRVYLRRATAWERLPGAAVLTLVVAGKPVLNPEFFPPVGVAIAPLPARRVMI